MTAQNNRYSDYQSLDPLSPTGIGEISDLYDDYMDSQGSQSPTTLNSGAAVYEQSVGPSYEDITDIPDIPRLNIGIDQSFVSDDSLDSSFAYPSNDNSMQINNNINDASTPQFSSMNRFYDSPKTPLINVTTTNNQSQEISRPIYYYSNENGFTNGNQLENGQVNDEDTDDEQETEEEAEEELGINNNNDNNDDDDDDEYYDDEEIAYLQARSRQAQSYRQHTAPSLNDWEEKGAAKILTQVKDIKTGKIVTKTVRKSMKDFKIGKELGEGSYSTVVLATDVNSGIQYAIKILNKKHIIKEKKVKYVNIEKKALNRLANRRGIVNLFYTFQDEQSLYFVLDFAKNGELLTLIKKYGSMDEDSTKYYTIQLIDSLSYMHNNGVIHRDLKPENVLIDSKMKIQITDFGTAKLMDIKDDGAYPADARAASFVGTAEYVSPELLNDKYCGKAADVWALGCIIYQMIAGKPPFKAVNEYLTFQKIIKLQYAFTAGFPVIVRDLIKRILTTKSRERLTLKDIKIHYWFKGFDWEDQDSIWNVNPPNLKPFKLSAKSMKPIPGLDKQYPNGSSTSLKNMKSRAARSSSNGRTTGTSSVVKSTLSDYGSGKNKSTPSLHTESSTNPSLKYYKQRSASAGNAKAKLKINTTDIANNKHPSSPVAATTTATTPIAKRKIRSASSAAQAALYGNPKRVGSSSKSTANSPSIPSTPPSVKAAQEAPQYTPPNIPAHAPTTAELKQMTADIIIKARQNREISLPSSSRNNNNDKHNTIPHSRSAHNVPHYIPHSQSTQNVDVIPGTNIPRPVLNTKITASKSININSKSRNNSSLKIKQQSDIPSRSILDMKWVQFMKHPDERIVKAGIVDVSREKTSHFEKKYRGMLAESPLGYRNRDNIATNFPHHSLFSSDDAESIVFRDPHVDTESEEEEEDPSTQSSATKFRKFFTTKQPPAPAEIKIQSRTIVITTFGRVLVFVENHDILKPKYEITSEVDLTNTNIHFAEVIGDRKIRPLTGSKGVFAIMSTGVSLAIEVDRQDVSQWTSALAKARLMEKERRLKELIDSSPPAGTGMTTGGEAAFAAATLAVIKSPGSSSEDSISSDRSPKSRSQFPSTLRAATNEKSAPHSKTKKENGDSNSTRSPMINAAISKAALGANNFANAGTSIGLGLGFGSTENENGKKRIITPKNSKFLARTRNQ